jgi:5-hydroxyisourate hydrolase
MISTHVLDTSLGLPARGIRVVLEMHDGGWREIATGETDHDGRVRELLPPDTSFTSGQFRLRFLTAPYFAARGVRAFYPAVTVEFEVHEATHHHVPLLLSPFGYSTYRGS